MMGIRAIGVVLLCLLGFKTVQGLMDNSSNPNGWVLAWSDEFDTPAIDRTKWDFEINCYGGGNNEKQCYVDKTDNVFQSGGVLNIRPIYWPNGYQGSLENCTDNNQNSCTWTQPATSGRIRTLKSVSGSWVYGRYEIRAKMPRGDFLWPAIWMLPTDWKYGGWAASGEIDIQEFRGQDRYIHLHTLHFGGQWPYNTYEGSGEINSGFDLTADFHTYVLEWDPWEIRWYLDGAEKHRATLERNFWSRNGPNPYNANRQPFDQRFHLILNLAVAGNFFDPGRYGYFDPYYHPTTWSQNFQVDFVRVFRWQD